MLYVKSEYICKFVDTNLAKVQEPIQKYECHILPANCLLIENKHGLIRLCSYCKYVKWLERA